MARVCKGEGLRANVVALTSSTGLSLIESCLLVAQRDHIDAGALFGVADSFFSYSGEGTQLGDVRHAIETAAARVQARDRGRAPLFWLDMFCASQNLLAGTYQDEVLTRQYKASSPSDSGYATLQARYKATKEDTDNIFGDAIEATRTIVFLSLIHI